MSQEYKIISLSASTNGGITETETTYVSTTAATLTFSALTMNSFSANTVSATTIYGNGSNVTGINLSQLATSAHTHPISEVVNLQTNLDAKITKPSNPNNGEYLYFNGSTWVSNTVANQVSAGASLTYFLETTGSTLPTYEYLSVAPLGGPEEFESATTINNNVVLIDKYATDAIGRTSLNGGIWEFNTFLSSSVISGTTNVIIDVYLRTSGGSETRLFSAITDNIITSAVTQYTNSIVETTFNCNASDRIVVYYSATTNNNVNTVVRLYHGGIVNYSHIHTPFSVLHNNLGGLQGGASDNYYHLTQAQLNTLTSNGDASSLHSHYSTLLGLTGGTVTGPTSFTNGLTANTFSATSVNINGTKSITNPERLLVDDKGAGGTGFSNTIIGKASVNNYAQLNITNQFAGSGSSSDIVATADNGNETTNYIDVGINGSVYSAGIVGGANDAYVYSTGNDLYIGNTTANKRIYFFTDGVANNRFSIGSASTLSYVPFSAATISATTYVGLPTDIRVTGGTYNAGTATFTNNTGGTFTVTGFSSSAIFNGGTVTGATVFTNTLSAITFTSSSINLTGSTAGQEFNLYRYSADNQAGGILSYKARGTSGAPSAVLSGDTIAVMGGRGYNGTGFTSTSKANISFIASENWSSTNQGTYISFNSTTSGSTNRVEVAKLDSTGLYVPSGITASTVTATTYQITGNTSNILFVKNGQINQNTNRFKWDDGNFGLLIASSGITTGATYQLQSPVFVQLDSNDFYHYNIQNRSTGSSASSEYVLTADNGDRDNKFFAVGINNSQFADPTYSLKTPNSGYLLMNGGNLFIGTQTAHDIVFHTSGTTPTKELMRMKPSGAIIIGGSSGTTDMGQELQVSGNTYVTGGITASTLFLTTGFKLGTSATNGYVLTTDSSGNGTWQVSQVSGATISSRVNGAVATTTSGNTTLSQISGLTSDSTHIIETYVTAKSSGTTAWGTWKRTLAVTTAGGVPTIRYTNADVDAFSSNLSATTVNFAVSGNNININVSGVTNTQIQWGSAYDIVNKSTKV